MFLFEIVSFRIFDISKSKQGKRMGKISREKEYSRKKGIGKRKLKKRNRKREQGKEIREKKI